MSSFDDWFEQYKLRSDWINLSEEDDVKNAYNAGLERAAEISEQSPYPDGMDIADAIRKEINREDSDEL
jgi:hypothetical protein